LSVTGNIIFNFVPKTGPENFVLVADLNVIQIVSLDPDTGNTPHTVYYGNAHSDIVTVVYDTTTDTVLWIDKSK